MNVLYRMVDAHTSVKIHPVVTSAFAQTQSSHWLKTTILVKVNTKHTFRWYTCVQYQQLVAHWMVVSSVTKFLKENFENARTNLIIEMGRRWLKGPFLSSPAANKRENVLDLQITLDDFIVLRIIYRTQYSIWSCCQAFNSFAWHTCNFIHHYWKSYTRYTVINKH